MSVTSIHPNRHDDDGQDPSQDLPAEMSVLGACLLSKDAITEVAEILRSEHFYRPAHQAIYECVLDMYLRGTPADAITMAGELEQRQQLTRIGGAPYLHDLIATVPTAANVGYYAEQVLDAADRRTVGQVGSALSAYATAPGAETAEVLERAQTRIADAVDYRANSGTGATLGSLLQPTMDEMDAIATGGSKGVPTGFADLDAVTNGLHPGEMVTVAARTGVGKSVLATDFCRAAAIEHGVGTLMFSLEMGRTELVMRMLAAEARVRLADIRSGTLSDEDWVRVANRMSEIEEAPLVIDDTATLTPLDVAGRARKWQRSLESQGTRLGLIVIDYLQLMSCGKKAESRQQEVSEISRNVKLLAKDLGVPVVALSQLNRTPEQRQERKPQLSDLRESGAIEQDSDKVILIHRPDAIDRDDPRMGEADLILAKHRGGPTTTVTVAHQLHYSRFVDMTQG